MEIRKILDEMVRQAALEIGFTFDEGCTESVETMLWVNHDIELNDDTPITYQIMNIISEEVAKWKERTKENYML